MRRADVSSAGADGTSALQGHRHRAVKRGVDVKIMVPSDDATDSPVVQHASHRRFGTLLAAGVKIREYERTLLHQKVIVIDGVWSSVGSTNFDDREVAAQLRAAFAADLRHARQRTLPEWQNRGLGHKLRDGLAYLGRSQF
ncbi:MAG TPA: phospholipase D-like domain-containing protein [Thermoanaerobaculia bacterium]|nr:phospholipase D-like domain-containing protein [Thermoanaerobaculia bacterium]